MTLRIRTMFTCMFLVLASFQIQAQDTITICKDVRNIIFTIFTTQGKAVAWDWTLNGGVYSGSTKDSTCGPVNYPTVGIYSANCKVTFSTGNDSIHRFIIKVFDGTVQPIPLRDTTICGNINLTLGAGNSGNPIAKFKWFPGNAATPSISVNQPGTYGVSVYTVDDYSYNCNGCVACDSISKFIDVKLGSKPVVNLGPDRFICNDFAVTLDAGTDGTEYIWAPNGETTQTISTAISGTYTVTVKNLDGCTASDAIFLKDSCPMYIFMPNSFTPDENNINDKCIWVGNMKMKKYTFLVFTRWGEKVFETTDPTKAWDGFYQGKVCPQGVYAYLLECVDTQENRHVLKGNITLLR